MSKDAYIFLNPKQSIKEAQKNLERPLIADPIPPVIVKNSSS